MFWKIYWFGVAVYVMSLIALDIKVSKMLETAYQESKDFRERIDTYTEPVGKHHYWENLTAGSRLRFIAVGLCPVVHWIVAVGFIWVVLTQEELIDQAIREVLDKILN